MPTYDTPEPISLVVELGMGDIRIEASDRADTIVEVRPSDPTTKADVVAAEQTRVEYANGHLTVKAPVGGWRQWLPHRRESLDVQIQLPTGSRLAVEAGVAALRCSGRIGDCRCKLGAGDVQLDEAGSVDLKTGFGDVTIERAAGRSEIVTGSGAVRIGSIGGPGIVKNSNGDTWIGEVVGDARVRTANGRISIDRAHEGVVAKTANGAVRLGEVARGVVVAESAAGEIEVGVRDGVPAWLDLHTRFGDVQNDLDASEGPGASEDSVEVRASTSFGNIAVHRSFASRAGSDAP